ncbi:hypothetical protein AB7C87_06420 [Natrarchaeobius sp. A-rgal3]|uniref:hypothetical protein n=1 Tax=Natrarchaeobius versutus TaxID=1679078 RepID=UPI00350FA916
MVERFKRRDDIDGCACLECRNVSAATTKRRVGDVILWSVGFLRTHPSVVAVFLGLAVLQFVTHLAPTPVELLLLPLLFVGSLFARGYAAMFAASTLSERPHTRKAVAWYTLRRVPAVFAIFVLVGLAMMALFAVGGVLVFVVLIGSRLWHLLVGLLGFVVLFCLFVVISVKFILAAEAAVVGGYGPIESLRVSWSIVSFRRRTTILLIGLVVALVASFTIVGIGAATEPYPVLGNETVRHVFVGLMNAATFLSTAITALVFAHVYVQGVLE